MSRQHSTAQQQLIRSLSSLKQDLCAHTLTHMYTHTAQIYMANNTIDASPGRPQEQHHQQIAKSSVWLNDAQHKQRARYKYFPYIFSSSFPLPKLLLLLYSWQRWRDASYVAQNIEKFFYENFQLVGAAWMGVGDLYVRLYVCVYVWATYFCWYFKYYEYALVYLLVYVFRCDWRRGWKIKQTKREAKSFLFESSSKIWKKTAGCQLWSA